MPPEALCLVTLPPTSPTSTFDTRLVGPLCQMDGPWLYRYVGVCNLRTPASCNGNPEGPDEIPVTYTLVAPNRTGVDAWYKRLATQQVRSVQVDLAVPLTVRPLHPCRPVFVRSVTLSQSSAGPGRHASPTPGQQRQHRILAQEAGVHSCISGVCVLLLRCTLLCWPCSEWCLVGGLNSVPTVISAAMAHG